MAAERTDIESFLHLTGQYPVIDVRSPGEYQHAHIPGAYSLPLFTDEERKVVGTAYKQQSRETAIKEGLDFFGPKMRKMVEEAEAICKNHHTQNSQAENGTHPVNRVLVYCWRGGMRSSAVAWLLDIYGFKVHTLIGGYKKFRNHVLETFRLPHPLYILGGFTGSGKTELLKGLQQKGETVIDLEAIASHKGSAFGNIGMPKQPTQEMFENKLALQLRKAVSNNESSEKAESYSPIWLEDESQRIGLVNIPHELWKTMRNAPVWFLEIPFEERLTHIVQEYGALDQERLRDAIGRISQKLGSLNANTAISMLNEGNIRACFEILLRYYDKFYFRSLHNREGLNSLLHSIECKSVTVENADLVIQQSHAKKQRIQA
ncbi:MAG: tRNA 2-selenouridine(34) synthase MnmH [Bacteroidetes bacterium]|nr:tRNA 2-selenouridine(34) synthase MnmH [Bacteroidota bacterium]